jgi:uncharacterized membrane protein YkvA (DUF1232 family)
MLSSNHLTSSQPSQIRTIRDLEQYMTAHDLSPEAMARKIFISNMTIRRMLRRKPSEKISEKYWPIFDQLLAEGFESPDSHLLQISANLFTDFQSLTQELENSGREYPDTHQLKEDVAFKLKRENIGIGLKTSVKTLLSTLSGPNVPLSSRAIAVGALLYFLNPADLIPDTLVGVGYLDDISVASVAISAIANLSKANRRTRS